MRSERFAICLPSQNLPLDFGASLARTRQSPSSFQTISYLCILSPIHAQGDEKLFLGRDMEEIYLGLALAMEVCDSGK